MSDLERNALLDIGREISPDQDDRTSIAIGLFALPVLRRAVKAAAEFQEAALRANAVFAQKRDSLSAIVGFKYLGSHNAGRHPRKGDFDWQTGRRLQGRRYRQACRAWQRSHRSVRPMANNALIQRTD